MRVTDPGNRGIYMDGTPPLGLTLPCDVRYVREADRIVVAVGSRELCVCLIDCWAPDRQEGTNAASFAARQAAQDWIDQAERVVLHVPLPPRVDDLLDMTDTVAGVLLLDDRGSLNEMLVDAKHCRPTA